MIGGAARAPLRPMFQQRHYEAVAETLRAIAMGHLPSVSDDTQVVWVATCRYFANMFARDNPKFKVDKFFKACGVGEEHR